MFWLKNLIKNRKIARECSPNKGISHNCRNGQASLQNNEPNKPDFYENDIEDEVPW